jgi:hypothetical protein
VQNREEVKDASLPGRGVIRRSGRTAGLSTGFVWLGGRDSNPDTQIQSSIEVLPNQQDQALTAADLEHVGQNPQYSRNKDYFDFEEDTLP